MTSLDRSVFGATPAEPGVAVTLLCPTGRGGQEIQPARIRMKNLVREAEEKLVERRLERGEIEGLIAPVAKLLEQAEPWDHLEEGLVVHLSAGDEHWHTLPAPVEEGVVVSSGFYVLPLVPFLEESSYLLLALSQKSVRLFLGDRDGLQEAELGAIPASLVAALGQEVETRRPLQVHSAGHTGAGVAFHGQGGQLEETKEELERFCHQVDTALIERVGDLRRPLVLATVDYLGAIYRRVSRYPLLVEEACPGNPDHLDALALRERAWPIVERHRAAERAARLAAFHERIGTQGCTVLRDVVVAACDGRVDTLLVAAGAHRWGRYDEEHRSVRVDESRSADSDELLNLAAARTLAAGGTVLVGDATEMPEDTDLAAIYRY